MKKTPYAIALTRGSKGGDTIMQNMNSLQARQIAILQEKLKLSDEEFLTIARKVSGDETLTFDDDEATSYETAAKVVEHFRELWWSQE